MRSRFIEPALICPTCGIASPLGSTRCAHCSASGLVPGTSRYIALTSNRLISQVAHRAALLYTPTPTKALGAIDLSAHRAVKFEPWDEVLIPTGTKLVLPPGACGLIMRRSGSRGFLIPNAPGLVDWDYRGELKVPTVGWRQGAVHEGVRFAQLLILPLSLPVLITTDPRFQDVAKLWPTGRGEAGFGSTG